MLHTLALDEEALLGFPALSSRFDVRFVETRIYTTATWWLSRPSDCRVVAGHVHLVVRSVEKTIQIRQ